MPVFIGDSRGHPGSLRRLQIVDTAFCPETRKTPGVQSRRSSVNRTAVFLTNNFDLPALTIAALYKNRWQVELFFKWIKQHLRIKQFYGTSENAVKTQIWIAVSVYVLVAIVKKRLGLEASLYTLMQVLSVTIFEKMPLQTALSSDQPKSDTSMDSNQLNRFGF